MTNGQWELEELKAVLEPEEGTQRSVSCRWKHGGLGPMGELGARSGPSLSGLLRAARATQCTVKKHEDAKHSSRDAASRSSSSPRQRAGR